MKKRKYRSYHKYDVVYADFGRNPNGVEGGVRPAIVVSCDASNHNHAPQVTVVPLSSKLKDIVVHVTLNPEDIQGYGIRRRSDFMPEDIQTLAKKSIKRWSGQVTENSGKRELLDRALIKQLDLLSVAKKMIMEESDNEEERKEA